MIYRQELRIARRAVKKGIVSAKDMMDCIQNLRGGENKINLTNMLIQKGYLRPNHIEELIAELESIDRKDWVVEGQTILGGYLLIEKLGEGAMGTVYKAQSSSTQKIVALKVLDQELAENTEFIARFLREAKNAAKLKKHNNIVEAYDFGEEKGRFYFAMELVNGFSLAQILYSRGKLSERQALTITKQVAQALEHVAQFSIIHRDIKPENIMISQDGIVKLCDLGLARDLSEDLQVANVGLSVGTIYYSSPEQTINSNKLDIRTDIYSLGISLYHMLAGELPFSDEDTKLVAKRKISENLPNILAKTPEISIATCKLLEKMTAKNKEQRYQNPKELIQEITQILHGQDEKVSFSKSDTLKKPKETDIVLRKKKKEVPKKNYYVITILVATIILLAILIFLKYTS